MKLDLPSPYRIIVVVALLASSFAGYAATITVTDDSDSGPGTLRQAVLDSEDGDVIQFDPALINEMLEIAILLESALLFQNKEVTIDASSFLNGGTTVIIDGGRNDRIMAVDSDSQVTLIGLKLQHGQAPHGEVLDEPGEGGGAILNNGGSVSLDQCLLHTNDAGNGNGFGRGGDGGAIFNNNNGTLIITNTLIEENEAGGGGPNANGGHGGGIFVESGSVTISEGSQFRNNRSGSSSQSTGGHGGAAYLGLGSFEMNSTLVQDNETGNGGYLGGHGAAIYNEGASATVTNSTFEGNRTGIGEVSGSGAAWYELNGNTSMESVTITNNIILSGTLENGEGGGIYAFLGTVNIKNCVIAGNKTPATAVGTDISGNWNGGNRSGVNLIGVNVPFSIEFPTSPPGSLNANGDFAGTAGAPINPLLAPLADNGGPTHSAMPYLGSPLIDPPQGSPSSPLTFDQRGEIRVINGAIDIGAVEAQPGESVNPPPPPANNSAKRRSIQKKIKRTKKKIQKAKKRKQRTKVKSLKRKLKKYKILLRRL